jgi:hypothetical protein
MNDEKDPTAGGTAQEPWGPGEEPTEQELREAEALREALEGRGEHALAELATALRAAESPSELPPQVNAALVRGALQGARRSGPRVLYLSFGAAAALALAAAVALLVGRGTLQPSVGEQAELVPSRSTQELFDAPFPRQGGTSARVDRIAEARARDYRSNLYARMGVR